MGRVVGIDLGTTNSAIATPIPGSGLPQALRTCDNSYYLGSLVAWVGDRWVVGQEADEVAKVHPENVIRSSKRYIGIGYEAAMTSMRDDMQTPDPLKVVPAPEGEWGVRFSIAGRLVSPVEVATRILRQLKLDAETFLGTPVTHAVIGTPAHFGTAQQEATREAGEAAGLIVQRIIEEPLAAVLAYGAQQRSGESGTVLVYDMGAGTFDVTIGVLAREEELRFVELAKQGDNHLGGDDFDRALMKHVAVQVRRQHGVDLMDDTSVPNVTKYLMRRECRKAKENLSRTTEAHVGRVDFEIVAGGMPVILDIAVTRDEFENLIRARVDESLKLVEGALSEARLTPEAIDQVLLVGGSTLIPMVRQRLRAMFGESKVRADVVDPMLAVATGASILAASLPVRMRCPKCRSDQSAEATRCSHCGASLNPAAGAAAANRAQATGLVTDIVSTLPFSMGIATDAGAFSVHIPRGTAYSPTSGKPSEFFRHPYYIREDGQRFVLIECYEGEAERAAANRYLGSFLAGPLPPTVKRGDEMTVELGLNGDRLIAGRLMCGDTNVSWEIQRDAWRTELRTTIVLAEDVRERISDPVTRERLDSLAARGAALLGAPDADSTTARLIQTELTREIDAQRADRGKPSAASIIGELRSCLDWAQSICELGETWVALLPQVSGAQVRQLLEFDGRQLDLLRSAREEGKRAEAMRDEGRARANLDRVRGLLSSLRIVYDLACGEMIGRLRPDTPNVRDAGGSQIRPLGKDELAGVHGPAASDRRGISRTGARPTQEECITRLRVMLGQMRVSIVTDVPRFGQQLAQVIDLTEAFFDQQR